MENADPISVNLLWFAGLATVFSRSPRRTDVDEFRAHPGESNEAIPIERVVETMTILGDMLGSPVYHQAMGNILAALRQQYLASGETVPWPDYVTARMEASRPPRVTMTVAPHQEGMIARVRAVARAATDALADMPATGRTVRVADALDALLPGDLGGEDS